VRYFRSSWCPFTEERTGSILVSHAFSFRKPWLLACSCTAITTTLSWKEGINYEGEWFTMAQNSGKRK
jgi:hypothetical protein